VQRSRKEDAENVDQEAGKAQEEQEIDLSTELSIADGFR
jgi:hypothetical protein